MPTKSALLARRRLAWHAWLDMPVGLSPVQLTGTEPAPHVIFGEPGLSYHGPYSGDAQPGWLVLVGIVNPGWSPVRGTDFTAPLTFIFPGRHILSADLTAEPAARGITRPTRPPSLAPCPTKTPPGRASHTRLQLTGYFLLRPRDSYTLTVLLSGTPAAGYPPILHDGTLASGRIIPLSRGSSAEPAR